MHLWDMRPSLAAGGMEVCLTACISAWGALTGRPAAAQLGFGCAVHHESAAGRTGAARGEGWVVPPVEVPPEEALHLPLRPGARLGQ